MSVEVNFVGSLGPACRVLWAQVTEADFHVLGLLSALLSTATQVRRWHAVLCDLMRWYAMVCDGMRWEGGVDHCVR